MESCCIYIYVLWIPSRTVVQCYYFVFHPHESAWWAPLNRFYAGLANFAQTCIGPILRVLHTCPTSIEDSKKIVCPLDLPHVRYHVCINDCIIYRGEDAEKTTCPVCGVSRYKKGKKAPRKVVWYFPITPRLQRYFADPKEAKLMRWHAERKKPG